MVTTSVVTIDGAALAASGPGSGGGGGGGGGGGTTTTTTTLAVTSVSPNTGTAAGGQRVTVNGTGFAAGATVTFGTTPAAATCTPTSCSVLTPVGADRVDVRVTNPNNQTSPVNSKDRYFFVPVVESLSPASGSTAGNTAVTITGKGFVAGATTVNFGAAAAPTVACPTPTTCNVTSPPGTAGTVDVTVTTAGGTSPASAGSKFAYQGATVTLAPTSLAFPDQTLGVASAARTVTLTNGGNAPLTISGIAVAPTTDFSVDAATTTCATSLGIGASCAVGVVFKPAATGAKSATLTITDSAGGRTVALTGTGINGTTSATLSATSLAFGDQAVNTTSPAKNVTVTNSGAATLHVTAANLSGTNAAEFAASNGCASVATGATCNIGVTFTPATAGANKAASLSIVSDAANSPQTVALSGNGVTPTAAAATLAPANGLTFGSTQTPQAVGVASAAQQATVTNTGTAPLIITSVGFAGANSGDFSQTSNCPIGGTGLAVNATCTVSIVFTPKASGGRSAQLSVTDNAAGSPQALALTGTAASAPVVALDAATLAFGSLALTTPPTPSTPKTVTLTNTGNAPLSISSIAISPTTATEFAQTNTCPIAPATLAAGANCTISVTFTPTTLGDKAASLSIASNAQGTPHTVALSGTGAVGAGTVANEPPANGHSILAFPQRDFVSADGYLDKDAAGNPLPVVVSVVRNGVEVFKSTPVTPAGPTGTVEVNHPGGGCWVSTTPDLRPGDIVRTTVQGTGVQDQTTIRGITAERPIKEDAGTVVIHGTADRSTLNLADLEQRLIASRQAFVVSKNARSLRAPGAAAGDGTLTWDDATSNKWTARYTGLQQVSTVDGLSDADRALNSESRIIWLGAGAAGVEQTIYENGDLIAGGPAVPDCTPPAEGPDTRAPSMPPAWDAAAISAKVDATTPSTVNVVFTKADDNMIVASYDINRDGTKVGSVAGDAKEGALLTYSDTGVPAGNHTYSVVAIDGNNNRSAAASAAPVTVATTTNASLSPSLVTFAAQAINTSSAAKQLTLLNNSASPASVTGVQLLGTNPTEFKFGAAAAGSTSCVNANGTVAVPSLASGASCVIPVLFAPLTEGAKSATVSVAVGGTTQVATVSGSALAALVPNDPPVLPHSLIAFPMRDFASAEGFTEPEAAQGVYWSVIRAGKEIARSTLIIPDAAGIVEVNHPGGGCWDATFGGTPDIKPGDIVRTTVLASGRMDQTTSQDVYASRPIQVGTTNTVVVHGTARNLDGSRMDINAMEQRLIGGQNKFIDNRNKRDVRADSVGAGTGTLAWDEPNNPSNANWTATYKFTNSTDVQTAMLSESRILWLGRDALAGNELTIWENGAATVGGPSAPCTAPVPEADTTAPYAVPSVRPAVMPNVTPNAVKVDFTAATDNMVVDHYLVLRNGTNVSGAGVKHTGDTNLTFTDNNVPNGSTRYSVIAVDAAGNQAPESVSVTIPVPVAPVVAFSPTEVTFVSQQIGSTSAAQTVTMTNTGNAPLPISAIVAGNQFLQTNNCVGTLDVGKSCPIFVSFQPTQQGTVTGTLVVSSSALGQAATLNLSGTGTPLPLPLVDLDTLSVTAARFGAPFPGSPVPSSDPQTLTLTNTGGATLTVSGISLGGANPGDFSQTNTCLTAAIPVRGSCTIQVTFTPTVNGLRSANLAIASNDPHSPATVELSGGASDPPSGGHSIIAFPVRDFISADGFTDVGSDQRVVVTVFRGGVELRHSDPIDPSLSGGLVEVNHPGGGCWAVQTPDIVPGDVIRTTVIDAATGKSSGRMDQTTVANVTAQAASGINESAPGAADGKVVVHGTASGITDITQLEQRMIAGSKLGLFAVNTRRDMRADSTGSAAGLLVWDDASHTTWTATYSGLVQSDVDLALAAQTRILWLGRDPLAGNELTTYEVGEVGGPAAPCVV